MKEVISMFSYFNFGGDLCGVYGATPFEMLHLFCLSLTLYLLLAIFDYASATSVLQAWFSCRCRDKQSGCFSLKQTKFWPIALNAKTGYAWLGK